MDPLGVTYGDCTAGGLEFGAGLVRGTSTLQALDLLVSLPFKRAASTPGALRVGNSAPSGDGA